jgi:hypothetical protein
VRVALVALLAIAAAGAQAQAFGTIEAAVTADPGQIKPELKLRAEGKGGTFESPALRLERVPPGTYSVYAFVQSPGYYFVRTVPRTVEVKAGAVSRVQLRYRTVLRGTMRITGALPYYHGLRQLTVDPVRQNVRTHTRTSIAVDGAFDVAGLDPGEYLVKLRLPTHALVWPVTIGDGVTRLNATASLHTIEGGTIDAWTGRVVDGADIDVRQLQASVCVDRFRVKSNVGRGGGIQISQLPAGRYELRFSMDGYAPRRMVVDVPRQASLGEIRLRPVSRAYVCPEPKIAAAEPGELPVIAAAIRYAATVRKGWWTNPEPVPGFAVTTELLLRDETVAVPFEQLDLDRVTTLRGKPLWQVFRGRAGGRRSIRAIEPPDRIRVACDINDESPSILIRRYPKASLAISASLPGIAGDEALVYVAAPYLDEGFVVYLQRDGGAWKARWHVQLRP